MSQPQKFRQVFQHASKDLLQWFPGHMAKGMRNMQSQLRKVDGIIEVHDARVPFSGRNALFRDKLSAVCPHLFVLNKIDLADMSRKKEIISRLKQEGVTDVIMTDCKQNSTATAAQIIPKIVELIKTSPRYDRNFSSPSVYTLMVIGVPNVGKSSLINLLRSIHMKRGGKPAQVGAMPGVTRAVQTGMFVSLRPAIMVLDTPGISAPNVPSIDAAMKLAVCHVLQDTRIGEDVLVDYLLFWLNKHGDFRYVEAFGMEKPTDKVMELLVHIATTRNIFQTIKPVTGGPLVRRVDLTASARWVLAQFRAGKLGTVMLDSDIMAPPSEIQFQDHDSKRRILQSG
ncbi:Mitochondrial ribosome-associated GTPase 1 [Hypsibius exemplaris]|uniref:Mitochondrial GTPase 1 n=1 Tax=Hypsibius exemplaris TaxID=2072580 RepID=A0A1W0X0L3_HYPEX|nr:Mitochondrial ribosome-associated GTPase 1 [Hypsibius exemplaris]